MRAECGAPPPAGHNIGVAVSIHIDSEIAKVFEVTAGVLSIESKKWDVAKVVFDPARTIRTRHRLFVPTVAGDNVESPVLIDIGDLCRFALTQIDGVFIERNFLRALRADAFAHPEQAGQKGQGEDRKKRNRTGPVKDSNRSASEGRH